MRILVLTHRLPHADVTGGHHIVYDRIKGMIKLGHEVGVISFIDESSRLQKESLQKILIELITFKAPSRNIFRRVANYCKRSSPVLSRFYSNRMMRAIGDTVENGKYDLVIAEFTEMGQYLYKNPYLPAIHKIISIHRCLTSTLESYTQTKELPILFRLKSWVQFQTIKKYEFPIYSSADRLLTMTVEDKLDLMKYSQALNIDVIPTGISNRSINHENRSAREQIILLTGFFGDIANADAAEWFLTKIWPKLRNDNPKLKFYIVGEAPPKSLQKIAKYDERVKITGYVEDLQKYLQMAQIFVCPVRLGAGIRPKCIEAMASGLPIVSTSLGMHGLPAENGRNCFIADTPELMIDSIEWLLRDERLRDSMSKKAQEVIELRYNEDHIMKNLERVLSETL